jgi:hypothetical protein
MDYHGLTCQMTAGNQWHLEVNKTGKHSLELHPCLSRILIQQQKQLISISKESSHPPNNLPVTYAFLDDI